ncbi:hypothetical protein JDV02_008065 [Purpureocillium takamizusanense]|uniref:Uncharacterized protein n=1 Tax=Purpureocillium takamizusanense TaxID=2060973 RepID=A0A9Q8QLY5_9HYPO|nr:uncharacterized protein JDV02_008065 [Purpureocillium takamizusanense]UNI22148.1 hypothetical protein JDV02_008065 [Purpureocillium takamizusanense]
MSEKTGTSNRQVNRDPPADNGAQADKTTSKRGLTGCSLRFQDALSRGKLRRPCWASTNKGAGGRKQESMQGKSRARPLPMALRAHHGVGSRQPPWSSAQVAQRTRKQAARETDLGLSQAE